MLRKNHLKGAVQRDSSGGGSPDSAGGEAQSVLNGAPGGACPIQTPITTALGLMQKMEGVARLLGGMKLCLRPCHDAQLVLADSFVDEPALALVSEVLL